MNKNGSPYYKRFASIVLGIARRALSPFSNKFSKKTYTQPQLAACICLMKHERKPYRDVVDELEELKGLFDFDKVPHYTTLQKFFKRIPLRVWDAMLSFAFRLFGIRRMDAAIDSTGYDERNASYHYLWRIGEELRRKVFTKHSIVVDPKTKAIAASSSNRRYESDNKTFTPLMKKAAEIVKIDKILADKGYDSERNHRFARERLHAESIIPARNEDVPVWKTKGRWRKLMKTDFPLDEYHKRSIVETVDSVEKRKFGSTLSSKLHPDKLKEVKVIDVIYDIRRCIQLAYIVIIGFLQSQVLLFKCPMVSM